MADARVIDQEKFRLSQLEGYEILDTLPEQAYDDIVALAAQICNAPIALMSLVDDHRQWFKAKQGIEERETERAHAFCAHAIEQDDMLIVPDACSDQRFAQNPLVTGGIGIRFYAGAQLRSPAGAALGTLCVIDQKARAITREQQTGLETLARQVMAHLELRRHAKELAAMAQQRYRQAAALETSEDRLSLILAASQAGTWDWNVSTKTVIFSEKWKAMFGYAPDEIGNDECEWTNRIHPDDHDAVMAWVGEGLTHSLKPFHREYRMMHKDGQSVWTSVRAVAVHDASGVPIRAVGTVLDISQRKAAEKEAHERQCQLEKVLDNVIALAGIVTIDGILSKANEVALSAAGLPSSAVTGRHFADTYWFSHSPELQQILRAAIEAASAGHSIRFDCRIKVGVAEFRVIDLSIRPVLDSDGEVEFFVPSAVDITERKSAEENLYRAKERAEITLNSIGDAVITTNGNDVIDSMNPAAEKLTGFTVATAVGQHVGRVLKLVNSDGNRSDIDPLDIAQTPEGDTRRNVYFSLMRADQTIIEIDKTVRHIKAPDGDIIGTVLTFRDVTEERVLAERISHQASHDSLTGLPNRHEFERRLELLLESSVARGAEHVLCYIDLDQFKIINDTCGHAAGDAMLTQLSNMLKTKIRKRDSLARLGGDEFGLLLGDCPIDKAITITADLKDAIRDFRFLWNDATFSVGASIGVTPIDRHSSNVAALLSAADSACYAAKEKGRNQIQVYNTKDDELVAVQGEMRWVQRLQDAIVNDRFVLYFQDIVPIDGRLETTPRREALLRLIEDDGNIYSPGSFLPAAERYGEIERIDRWVINRVCRILRATRATDSFACNINLSGRLLANENFLDFVLSRVDKIGTDSARICFEITETAAISNLHAAQRFITALRTRGCRFSLDDFGSGLASFNYLKNLQVDQIKIDGSFVRDMIADPVDRAMVEAIQHVATLMNIETVAEHVGDEETLEALRAIGINYAQGFHLSMPRSLPGFTARSAKLARNGSGGRRRA